MVGEPERQCIGCGRRGPQAGFMRLGVAVGAEAARVVVVQGTPLSGRGAYLCRRRACVERALLRKAFQKAFRIALVVDRDELMAAVDAGDGQAGCGEEARLRHC